MTPAERTAAMLAYVQKASQLLEANLRETGELPPWVVEKVLLSAQNMGMAVSFLRKKKAEPKKKSRGVA